MKSFATLGLFLSLCLASCAGSPSPHWNNKATLNERIASASVGGFSDDEARLYHFGVQHIVNARRPIGSLTIRQVIDQEQSRENARDAARQRIADEKAARDEKARQRQEQAAYAAAHHDYCADAMNDEKLASSNSASHRTAYGAAVRGLEANDQCNNDDAQLVNKGFLLSMKAFAEHYLSEGDSQTDFNQANALLVECQTRPGLYGTRVGANCESQEQNNIEAQTNWDIESRE